MKHKKTAAALAGSVLALGIAAPAVAESASQPEANGDDSVARTLTGQQGDLGTALKNTLSTAASGELSGATPLEALTGNGSSLLGGLPLGG
ncbi:hypothetical protein [Streptomyces xiaopingdaonensis]|uniref:hypothetical protein n=1 Tax=Streptomyces xiaopingdaonensis TaxID=1565415 RepID=UPI00031CF15E|nr:hypothetical protein [Streptomyces xiaopingdaonensis]